LEAQVETSPAQRFFKTSFFVGTEDNKRDRGGRHSPQLGDGYLAGALSDFAGCTHNRRRDLGWFPSTFFALKRNALVAHFAQASCLSLLS
jgi:hypothetical protein